MRTTADPDDLDGRVHVRSFTPAAVLVVLVALVLRLIELDSQLWLDEVSALTGSIRRPLLRILSEWPPASSHVLYEALANLAAATFGESPWSLRLPAVLSGAAGVAALYVFARRVAGERTGLLAAGFLAVSYHHVFFSQNARGYTLLILLFLLSALLFMDIERSRRLDRRQGLLYALVSTLAVYSQPFGVFVPAANLLLAVGLYIRDRRCAAERPFPLRALTGYTVLAGALTALLYAPFVPGMLAHARMNAASDAEGPKGGAGLLMELIAGLQDAFFGPAGLAAAGLIGAAGGLLWLRRRPVVVLLLGLPIALEFVSFVAAGFGIHPRYFAIAIPVAFLLAADALDAVVTAALDRVHVGVRARQACTAAVLVAAVLVSALPLRRYYTLPKQDFDAAAALVRTRPDAACAGIHSAGFVLTRMHRDLDVAHVVELDELLRLESGERPVLVVTTLEGILRVAHPAIVEHVESHYVELARFPGTVGDGTVHVYARSEP